MARCAGITRDGRKCSAGAMAGSEWCYSHDPGRAEERSRNASRGGRSGGRGRSNGELTAIKAQLSEMVEAVLSGEGQTSRYAVAGQLINTRLRAVELERKIREQDELLERIDALEGAQGGNGGQRWGA